MSYLPNNLASDVVVSLTRVQQNDAALDTAISGNLTQANFSAATQIPNSMLASPNCEGQITLRYDFGAAATTGLKDLIFLGGNATYTLQSISYTIFNPAAATPTTSLALTGGTPVAGNTFVVEAGNITAGAWVVSNTILASTQFYSSATATQTASGTLATSTETAPIAIGLRVTAVNTPPESGAVHVTIRYTRTLQ